MNYAVIVDGTVNNIVVLDETSDWKKPEASQLVELNEHDIVGIGYEYVDGKFIDPNPEDSSFS